MVLELDGAVEVERAAAAQPFTADPKTDDDYPSGAVAPDGTVWAAWQSFTPGLDRAERAKSFDTEPADLRMLATPPGADQLWLRPTNGKAIAITPPGGISTRAPWRWTEQDGLGVVGGEPELQSRFPIIRGRISIFSRAALTRNRRSSSEPVKLSDSPESDVWPVAATDSEGHVWLAWQGARDSVFRIFERHQTKDGWSPARQVSTQTHNCWAPAIASTTGKVAIAWDTYEKGDYDVWMREFSGGKAGEPGRWRIRRITKRGRR